MRILLDTHVFLCYAKSDRKLQSFEVSKKNLKVSYVDSLVLHSPLENIEKLMVVWQTREYLRAARNEVTWD